MFQSLYGPVKALVIRKMLRKEYKKYSFTLYIQLV